MGFEPTVGYPNARFQDGCLKPLSHFSFKRVLQHIGSNFLYLTLKLFGLRAGKTGLEPVTSSLTSCYSNQLSYFPKINTGFILFVERSVSRLKKHHLIMMLNLLFLHGFNLVNTQLVGNRFIVAVT